MRRTVIAVGVPLLLSGLWILNHNRNGKLLAQGETIPAPTTWVAFDADLLKTNGHIDVYGHFYRSSNGSTRKETGPKENPSAVIGISNISQNKYFEWDVERGSWFGHPMRAPSPSEYHPGLRRTSMRGLEVTSEKVDGFSVVRHMDDNGVLSLQAPDLNFFPLVTEDRRFGDGGARQVFKNIQVRDQADALFEPPAGAAIVWQSELRGLVRLKHGEDPKNLNLPERVKKRLP